MKKNFWRFGAFVMLSLGISVAVLGFFVFRKANPTVAEAHTGQITYLIAGTDEVGKNTDMMMLASFNQDNGNVSLLQIPRDTYLKTENQEGKINQLFHRFAAVSTPERAAEKLCQKIDEILDIPIDGYVLFPLSVVENIVDMVGGVSVDVPCDMTYTDPQQNLHIHIKKGVQILNGKQAAHFIRFRSEYAEGDLGRLDAQMLFFSALLSSVNHLGKIPQYLRIYQKIAPNLLTNLQEKDIISIIMVYLKNRQTSDFLMMRLPGEACRAQNGVWYYIVNKSASKRMLQTHFFACYGGAFDTKRAFVGTQEETFLHIYEDPNGKYRIFTPHEAGQIKIVLK